MNCMFCKNNGIVFNSVYRCNFCDAYFSEKVYTLILNKSQKIYESYINIFLTNNNPEILFIIKDNYSPRIFYRREISKIECKNLLNNSISCLQLRTKIINEWKKYYNALILK